MTLDTSPAPFDEPGHRPPLWLQILLGLGFLLSLGIGVLALVALLFLEQNAAVDPPPAPPAQIIQPDQIPPQLALLQLAGAPPDALTRQAADAGQRTLGLALVLLDGSLPNRVRGTEAVRIGQRHLDDGERQRAAAAYHTARLVAITGVDLPVRERGRLLAQSAIGLAAAEEPLAALDAAQQAQRLAVQAPTLLPAQRAQILQEILPVVRAHGSAEQIRQMEELLRSPIRAPDWVLLRSRWQDLQQPFPVELSFSEAVATRQEAARRLIERLELTGGVDFEPERQALHLALLREDQVRAEMYDRLRNSGLELTQEHALLQHRRAWQILKLRVAAGGFGVRLVPEWEENEAAIRGALQRTTNELVAVIDGQIRLQTEAVVGEMLRLEALHWLAAQQELGFYPAAPLGELSTQMEQAQNALRQLGAPPGLPLFYNADAQPPGFRIVPLAD